MENFKESSKGCEYVIVTDNVTYWCRNFKKAAVLKETLEDENIDYIYLMIVGKKFHKKKNTTRK